MASFGDFFASLRAMLITQDRLVDPWTQIPHVRGAVGSLYNVVSGVPLRAYSGRRGVPDESKPLGDDHPLSVLLARPNPFQSGGEFAASIVAYQLLDGAAFVLLYGEGSKLWEPASKAPPREMLPLDPRTVSVAEGGRDTVTGLVRKWQVTTPDGATRGVPAESVLHVREFNPRDLQAGSAPLSAVWQSMEADRLVDVFARALLENGANPGTIVALKSDPGAEARKQVRDAFDEKHRGAHKAGRTAVIGADVDIKPFPAQTSQQMQTPEMRDETRDRIKAVLGVTDYEVGKIADYNRANSESARAWLWTNTILPRLSRIEQSLWAHVFEPMSRGKTMAVWPAFDLTGVSALKPMLSDTATTARTLIETGFDPVQVSQKLDLGLDFVDIVDPTPPTPPPPEPAKTGLTIIIRKAARAVKPLSRAAALRVHAAWARHAERKLGVRWRKFTAARYADTIRIVRNLTDLGPVDAIMGSPETWRAGAQAAAEGGLRGVGPAVSDNLRAELGGFARIDAGQSAYEAAAARRVGQMVDVGMRLRTSIRDTITRTMLDAPQDLETLERVVREKFGGRLPSNAATVARTETGIFASDVRRNLMVAEGVDEHEWSASLDVHTRETHRAVDGERRPMDQRFSNGLLHPLETGAPAGEVVNCRCLELPYMREVDD